MIRNTRAGAAPEVHTYVEAVGIILGLKRRLRSLGELHHLRRRGEVRIGKRRYVLVGHDHQVPACVRKEIEDDEILLSAMNEKVFRIRPQLLHAANPTNLYSVDATYFTARGSRCVP